MELCEYDQWESFYKVRSLGASVIILTHGNEVVLTEGRCLRLALSSSMKKHYWVCHKAISTAALCLPKADSHRLITFISTF